MITIRRLVRSAARATAYSAAALFRWSGDHIEQLKLIFVVIAAFWVLFEYKAKEEQTRASNTWEYVKQSNSQELISVDQRLRVNSQAASARMKNVPSTNKVQRDLVLWHAAQAVADDVWKMHGFYNGLAVCANSGVCSPKAACSLFGLSLKIFSENYTPYFDFLRAETNFDAMTQIRMLLANKYCT